jgi:RNA polymerase sigma-70 factor (ECF subfamily)
MEAPLSNDQQLLQEARESPQAFALLYRRHYDMVLRYCVHRLFDRSAAEDAAATVFLKVLERFDGFTGHDERTFRNWLYAIATNVLNSHGRRGRLWDRFLELRGRFLPRSHSQPPLDAKERLTILRRAILALNPHEQAIVTLRYFEGLDTRQIAETLGGSPATVRSQLSRALAKLRRQMQPAGMDEVGEVLTHG